MRNIIPTDIKLLEADELKLDIFAQAQNETINNTSFLQPSIPEMAAYWVPVENMGKAIVNGEVTMANAKEKTEAFNDSLKAQK